jgi:uncharacterized protein
MGMGCYLFIWGVFTTGNCFASWKGSKVIWLVFVEVAILFYLLAIGAWSGNVEVTKAAGAIGVKIGFLATYAGAAEFINEMYGKTVLPLISPGEKMCAPAVHH